jgi:hypothetical protein
MQCVFTQAGSSTDIRVITAEAELVTIAQYFRFTQQQRAHFEHRYMQESAKSDILHRKSGDLLQRNR